MRDRARTSSPARPATTAITTEVGATTSTTTTRKAATVAYLKETRDKGLIFKMPSATDKLKIDCFVDADFAGLWNSEDHNDPHSVRSRTGYVILVNDAPVVWSSKLQTETACSTMESEYIALSTACKELIPLRRLVAEIADAVGMERDKVDTMHTTIWEDNVGALTLANLELPRLTPSCSSPRDATSGSCSFSRPRRPL